MLNLLTLLPAKTYFNVVQKPLELMTYKFVTFLFLSWPGLIKFSARSDYALCTT